MRQMAQLPVDHIHDLYAPTHIFDLTPESLPETEMTAQSPYSIMWQVTGGYTQSSDDHGCNNLTTNISHSYFDPAQPVPIVEFTDLTTPNEEDRRRRRPLEGEQPAISSMHMRRRAQNRASQRAFRERKEKHAQELQRQLEELETKYKMLEQSYEKLQSTNKELLDELTVWKTEVLVAYPPGHPTQNPPHDLGVVTRKEVRKHGGSVGEFQD